jgi:hypothetical protein
VFAILPKHPQDSGNGVSDQWSVVERSELNGNYLAHHWRLVTLKSPQGTFRPGLQCADCSEIKVLSQKQIDSHFGRGVEGWR